MKLKLLFLVIVLNCSVSRSQSLYYPPLTSTTWDTIDPQSLGWCQDRIDSLYTYLGNTNTKAFILLRGGKIVLEKYYGTFTIDSLWYWASAGKTITSFTVGIAKQEGLLSLTDSTSKYLGTGWSSEPANKERLITIRHQLTMTSGLNDGVPDNHCTIDTCLQYLADAGTRWAYHNGPYTLLDGVIQSATGQTLNTYFTQKVKNQTGITGSFFMTGYDNVYVSKARSMARFGLLILGRGKWNGNTIMSDTSYFNAMTNTSQNLNPSYGYLWWLNGKSSFKVPGLQFSFPGPICPHAPIDMIAALGKNSQVINVVPSQDLVLIRMGNTPGTSQEVEISYNDSIWKKLNAAMCVASNMTESDDHSIRVYPNPANDVIHIEGAMDVQKVEIIDMRGRVLLVKERSKMIDMSDLDEGVYFLRYFNGSASRVKKIILAR
jgi:CubicO group peptidase (beta-lactamase class C family)